MNTQEKQLDIRARLWRAERSTPDDLRAKGLRVVSHYELDGASVWFMAGVVNDENIIFEGKAETDQLALDQIRAQYAERTDKRHHAPMCPANHYHGRRAPTGDCNCGA